LFDLECELLGIWLSAKSFFDSFGIQQKFLNGGNVLAKVKLRDGESQDRLLRRFRKVVIRSGVLSEVRKRRWFVSKSEQRRIERKKAIRRIKKRARMNQY